MKCRWEHRDLRGEDEKNKFKDWKAAQGNPVVAAQAEGMCWMWAKLGSCGLNDNCKFSASHTEANKPKDKDGNPTTIKPNEKGKGKKGKGQGKGNKGKGRGRK